MPLRAPLVNVIPAGNAPLSVKVRVPAPPVAENGTCAYAWVAYPVPLLVLKDAGLGVIAMGV